MENREADAGSSRRPSDGGQSRTELLGRIPKKTDSNPQPTRGPASAPVPTIQKRDEEEEEEEGMLKVDEEGQIEEDNKGNTTTKSQGPHPAVSSAVSLESRSNLPNVADGKNGRLPPTSSADGPSPRHGWGHRSRASRASPEAAAAYGTAGRSRFGYASEASAPYTPAAPYTYPANHRDALRAGDTSAGLAPRNSFSAAASRVEWGEANRRGQVRGSDSYRPGAAVREREREREWELMREREWALERERDPYRYAELDERRNWEQRERERFMGGSRYDAAAEASSLPHPGHPSYSGPTKYGMDAHPRDYAARRPPSPSSVDFDRERERERDWDRDRDRDRDRLAERDVRPRPPKATRVWGRPSDASVEDAKLHRQEPEESFGHSHEPESERRASVALDPSTTSAVAAVEEHTTSEAVDSKALQTAQPDGQAQHANKAETQVQSKPGGPDGEERAVPDNRGTSQTVSAADRVDLSTGVKGTDTISAVQDGSKEGVTRATEEELVSRGQTSEQADVPDTASKDETIAVVTAKENLPREVQQDAAFRSTEDTATRAEGERRLSAQAEPLTGMAKEDSADLPRYAAASPNVHLWNDVSEHGTTKISAEPQVGTAKAEGITSTTEALGLHDAEKTESEQPRRLSSADATTTATEDMATNAFKAEPETSLTTTVSLPAVSSALEATDLSTVAKYADEEQAERHAIITTETSSSNDNPAKLNTSGLAEQPESESVERMDSVSAPQTTKASIDEDVVMTEPQASATVRSQDTRTPADLNDNDPITRPEDATKIESVTAIDLARDLQTVEAKAPSVASIEPKDAFVTNEQPEPAIEDVAMSDAPPAAAEESITEPSAGLNAEPVEKAAGESITEQSVAETVLEPVGVSNGPDNDRQQAKPAAITPAPDSMGHAVQRLSTDAPNSNSTAEEENGHQGEMQHVPSSEEPIIDGSTEKLATGPDVAAKTDAQENVEKIELPPVDYGIGKAATALLEEEQARIEEVQSMREREQQQDEDVPRLKIAEMREHSEAAEPPMMTPRTKEQTDSVRRATIRRVMLQQRPGERGYIDIIRENQRIALSTTMDVMHAKVHGIPLMVKEEKPLWIDENDADMARTKDRLYTLLGDQQRRLNDKVEKLKARYRSINEEWKLHCARLDRIAERREMQRRPPVNTPAGTPGGAGLDEGGASAGSGGILGGGLMTGRANRRSAQTGFAGFGDAVRSEAEFLEILASLENADMQDPNMRAARTTAVVPDMEINPNGDQPLKRRYDDINGFVADPLAFYLDEFDPDVWSEEEKAIFARRYALWPKQFGKIAQALPHKTPAQCVRYYYLNKKVPGNDFKALAAARNRERKRKARVKPKKAKGSALMADLKSAKGEEVEEEEATAAASPGEAADSPVSRSDPATAVAAATVGGTGSSASRRGGARSRMSAGSKGDLMTPANEDGAANPAPIKKRSSDADAADASLTDAKVGHTDKRRAGPKSKRAKTDSATSAEKSKKSRSGAKKEAIAVVTSVPKTEDAALTDTLEPATSVGTQSAETPLVSHPVPAAPSPAGAEAPDGSATALPAAAASTASKAAEGVPDSDLAAAEALGALAGLFGGGAGEEPKPKVEDAVISGGAEASPDRSAESFMAPPALDADGQKAAKKRRGKNATGSEDVDGGGKARSKQPTSSYWSVAERSEFLRSLALHGKRWDVVSSTLSQKSAAQARNFFARNASEADFSDAAALAESNAHLSLAEREAAATAFVRQRFVANSQAGSTPASAALPPPPPPPSSTATTTATTTAITTESNIPPSAAAGVEADTGRSHEAPRATYLPPPPGLPSAASGAYASSQSTHVAGYDKGERSERSDDSPPPTIRRGLQINSLLNSADDVADARAQRRSSIQDWHGAARSESGASHASYEGREGSVPPGPGSYVRPPIDAEGRPSTASRIETRRPTSSDGRMLEDEGELSRARMYDAYGPPRPTQAYANMAPPPHHYPGERSSSTQAARYSLPPSIPATQAAAHSPTGHGGHLGHASMSVPPHHLVEPTESSRLGYSRYASAQPEYRGTRIAEHESSSALARPYASDTRHAAAYDKHSPTGTAFPSMSGMGRYTSPGVSTVASMYPSSIPPSLGSARERGTAPPQHTPGEHRWSRVSESPGPSASPSSAGSLAYGAPAGGAYSTGNTYRSSSNPYSSYASHSLPRPSLPSLSASAAKAGAPTLPTIGSAGRSLPPLLGTFPGPGPRMLGSSVAPRSSSSEDPHKWPYPHRSHEHERERER